MNSGTMRRRKRRTAPDHHKPNGGSMTATELIAQIALLRERTGLAS